ncbi:MAG: YcjX family protein [Pseudomonadota bacterium]
MGLFDIVDDMTRFVEETQERVGEVFEPSLRLGVTGLSRAGKTVFIACLVQSLMDRGRMKLLSAEADGRILAAALRPGPDRRTPRFDQEAHMAALLGGEPAWPESTRSVSTLRLSFRLRPSGLLGPFTGPSTLHLDVTDYPGEWLLDLPLMEQSYAKWSERALAEAEEPARAPHACEWLARAKAAAADEARFEEAAARDLAEAFKAYLAACRADGLSGLAPGRFLMPGDLEGSPALAFAPLPPGDRTPLRREMEKRYDAYKRAVVLPFFRDHFARLDRQAVLVDLLSAVSAGPRAIEDLQRAMARILEAFKPGAPSWLAPLLGRRVDRILFAATKADHIHHSQHGRLANLLRAMLRQASDRAEFRGAKTKAFALAALRATTETTVRRDGRDLDLVRGRLLSTGKQAALWPGELPEDPGALLDPARREDGRWLNGDFGAMAFAPPRLSLEAGDGPPHIRLDRAAQFLIGDRLS